MGRFYNGKVTIEAVGNESNNFKMGIIDLSNSLTTSRPIVGEIKKFVVYKSDGTDPTSYTVQVFNTEIADYTEYQAKDLSAEYSVLKASEIDSSDDFRWEPDLNNIPPYRNLANDVAVKDDEDNAKIWIAIVSVGTTTDDDYTVVIEFENRGRR